MIIHFSRHAKRQMQWRKICEEEIQRVIDNPCDVTPSVKDRLNYWERKDHQGLKITVIKDGDEIIVVTVIRKGE